VEDRDGFLGFQVLELLEKEQLLPRLTIPESAVQRYYVEHQTEFHRPKRVKGTLLRFDNMGQKGEGHEQSGEVSNAPVSDAEAAYNSEVEFEYDELPFGMEAFRDLVVASPIGTRIGPFRYNGNLYLFIKRADIGSITVPMSDVAKVINDRLVRVMLDEKERILAATLAKQMVIDDHFDYARIGLRRAELALPWN
jgi:hypothetical protein